MSGQSRGYPAPRLLALRLEVTMFTVWVRMGAKHNAVSMAGKSWDILRANMFLISDSRNERSSTCDPCPLPPRRDDQSISCPNARMRAPCHHGVLVAEKFDVHKIILVVPCQPDSCGDIPAILTATGSTVTARVIGTKRMSRFQASNMLCRRRKS